MNSLFAIHGYCRSTAISSNGNHVLPGNELSDVIKVLESLSPTRSLTGDYLKELALVIARPDLKSTAVFPSLHVIDKPNEHISLQKSYNNLQKVVLPIPFAIERAQFFPNLHRQWLDVKRELLIAEPVENRTSDLSFKTWWGITDESEHYLRLSQELYYDANPYWKEYMRSLFRQNFNKPIEEHVMYIATSEYKLHGLLDLRESDCSKEEDLKRGLILDIPKEAAKEFSSMCVHKQVEENNRVAKAIENGILPKSLYSAWWWTTINCFGRPDEIKLANEVDHFFAELEQASSPRLLEQLKKE